MPITASPGITEAISDLSRGKQEQILNALLKLGLDQNDALAPLIAVLVEADLATHQAVDLVEKTPDFIMTMIEGHNQIFAKTMERKLQESLAIINSAAEQQLKIVKYEVAILSNRIITRIDDSMKEVGEKAATAAANKISEVLPSFRFFMVVGVIIGVFATLGLLAIRHFW